MIDVSIISVSYNSKDLLIKCLESVKRFTKGISFEVIVVDNNSKDGSVEALKNLEFRTSNFELIENKDNRGFGAANNQGIRIAKGRYILFLNPDTQLVENAILKMVNWMDSHPKVGISSCKLINADGSVQPTGGFFPDIYRVFLWSTLVDDIPFINSFLKSYHPKPNFYKKERSLDWVTGAFFLMRRELIGDVRGFDEDYFLYVEEVDFCYRAKRGEGVNLLHIGRGSGGWEIRYVPITHLIHRQGASGTTEGMIVREFEGLKIFYRKHYGLIEGVLLKIFLIYGCLVRIILFAIIKPGRSKIYARAITKI